jgi:hypothetical protein
VKSYTLFQKNSGEVSVGSASKYTKDVVLNIALLRGNSFTGGHHKMAQTRHKMAPQHVSQDAAEVLSEAVMVKLCGQLGRKT